MHARHLDKGLMILVLVVQAIATTLPFLGARSCMQLIG